jgi:hypothetical protein
MAAQAQAAVPAVTVPAAITAAAITAGCCLVDGYVRNRGMSSSGVGRSTDSRRFVHAKALQDLADKGSAGRAPLGGWKEADAEGRTVLRVVSYNVLCDAYATSSERLPRYCNPLTDITEAEMQWPARYARLLLELDTYSADIVMLQEIARWPRAIESRFALHCHLWP